MGTIGYMDEIGMRVRERRRLLGIDQATAADLAGISRKTVSEIERGKATVRMDVLARLLEVLGFRIEIV